MRHLVAAGQLKADHLVPDVLVVTLHLEAIEDRVWVLTLDCLHGQVSKRVEGVIVLLRNRFGGVGVVGGLLGDPGHHVVVEESAALVPVPHGMDRAYRYGKVLLQLNINQAIHVRAADVVVPQEPEVPEGGGHPGGLVPGAGVVAVLVYGVGSGGGGGAVVSMVG